MEDERWRRIEDLYHLALERESEQRTAFLEQACGGDGSLLQEVESLLSNDGPDTVLDRPAAHLLPESITTVVGHYRLLQKIGEGGMGEVWPWNGIYYHSGWGWTNGPSNFSFTASNVQDG